MLSATHESAAADCNTATRRLIKKPILDQAVDLSPSIQTKLQSDSVAKDIKKKKKTCWLPVKSLYGR